MSESQNFAWVGNSAFQPALFLSLNLFLGRIEPLSCILSHLDGAVCFPVNMFLTDAP